MSPHYPVRDSAGTYGSLRQAVLRLEGKHAPAPVDLDASADMPCLRLDFSTQQLPVSKFAELDRQLAGQQAGLNALTVDDYLRARERFGPGSRDPGVARRARRSWRDKLLNEHRAAATEVAEGGSVAADERGAREEVQRLMRGLHALHNPDLVAGGKDVIADFGDGEVNVTIGRQWVMRRGAEPSRVDLLDAAARHIPAEARCRIRMNGCLRRSGHCGAPPCDPASLDAAPGHGENDRHSLVTDGPSDERGTH